MATSTTVVETIQQGTDRVVTTFGTLSDEQLELRVHAGDHGWTVKEVLAHLAGRQAVNDRLFKMAAGDEAPIAGGANFDDWNQTIVDALMSKSRDALLAEFQAVQNALIAQVTALSDDQLAVQVPLPNGMTSLGNLLAMAGGAHAGHHAEEVEHALAEPASS